MMPPYSVMKPETSSFSVSGRSKGERLLSAMMAIRKIKKPMGCKAMRGQLP